MFGLFVVLVSEKQHSKVNTSLSSLPGPVVMCAAVDGASGDRAIMCGHSGTITPAGTVNTSVSVWGRGGGPIRSEEKEPRRKTKQRVLIKSEMSKWF